VRPRACAARRLPHQCLLGAPVKANATHSHAGAKAIKANAGAHKTRNTVDWAAVAAAPTAKARNPTAEGCAGTPAFAVSRFRPRAWTNCRPRSTSATSTTSSELAATAREISSTTGTGELASATTQIPTTTCAGELSSATRQIATSTIATTTS
jgi:hypothetical protein